VIGERLEVAQAARPSAPAAGAISRGRDQPRVRFLRTDDRVAGLLPRASTITPFRSPCPRALDLIACRRGWHYRGSGDGDLIR
jgi:hypothetical protein